MTLKLNVKVIVSLLIAASMLSSCQGNKKGAGTAIGAIAGGLLGSQFGKGSGNMLAVGAGALAGAFVGNEIGNSMDKQDKMMMQQSTQKALEHSPSGQTISWTNPDSKNKGYVKPMSTFKDSSGQYCREYTQTVSVGGKEEIAYGTACRKPDGQWEIVK